MQLIRVCVYRCSSCIQVWHCKYARPAQSAHTQQNHPFTKVYRVTWGNSVKMTSERYNFTGTLAIEMYLGKHNAYSILHISQHAYITHILYINDNNNLPKEFRMTKGVYSSKGREGETLSKGERLVIE